MSADDETEENWTQEGEGPRERLTIPGNGFYETDNADGPGLSTNPTVGSK